MKLFTRYNIILLLISLFGVTLIGYLFYLTQSFYLNKQIDHDMVEEIIEVKESAEKNIFYEPHEFEDLIVQYKSIERLAKYPQVVYGDTVFLNPLKHQRERARYLATELSLIGKPYQVMVIASKFEREEQIRSICIIILFPVILLLSVLLLVNRIMIRNLWKPFNKLIENLSVFNLSQGKPFEPIDTPIEEFKLLNDSIVALSKKVRADYQEIKLFTENASHEMMTPLAVINSKLDMMLQSNVLNSEDGETLTDLYRATSRLTKLNQSLLLLVKIDNNLLKDQQELDVKKLIQEKISYFQELILKRELKLHTSLQACHIFSSFQLMDILINNLFSNVIRHNYDEGEIVIQLTDKTLIFKNTGHNKALDQEKIFERFYKDTASEGTGLGLSILQQICLKQNFNLGYYYEKDLHVFTINF